MVAHPRAGTPATAEDLIDVDAVERAYYDVDPDLDDPSGAQAEHHAGCREGRHGVDR